MKFGFDFNTKFAILAQDELTGTHIKTAIGALRYASNQVVCIIDSSCSGRSLSSVLGIEHSAPIVSTISQSLTFGPEALILGISLIGGKLPDNWRKLIIEAISPKPVYSPNCSLTKIFCVKLEVP